MTSLKQRLGLSALPLTDSEIMRQIKEAYSKKQEIIEFVIGKKKVRINLRQLTLDGVTDGHYEYYKTGS